MRIKASEIVKGDTVFLSGLKSKDAVVYYVKETKRALLFGTSRGEYCFGKNDYVYMESGDD